ncbi:D-alanine--D-alanine ligase family protein [Sandaracinus amylolyticus]|uniref:D-alanine--D-alanine ligase family protein n=1 Tax=Sandaracinus amylolyticus TaxID=927083 RepID=UPI001F2F9BF7|nr:ATP-grasp domain-containing protein [Sandaracinus amylolyticus]
MFADDLLLEVPAAGVYDLLRVPHTGGGPGEFYLAQDKALAKKLLAYEQILYPRFAVFPKEAGLETGGNLRMPLFVKPLCADASIGIDAHALVHDANELMRRVLKIHDEVNDAALAEEYIEGRELYVGVLGNAEPIALPPIEVDFSGMPAGALHVLDRAAKWETESAVYKGTKSVIAKLEPELEARVKKVAVDAYRALRVRDYGRVDLRLAPTGEIYVIEVNPSCYLERSSELAMAAGAAGIEYEDLVQKIVDLAIERFHPRAKARRRTGK